MKPRIRLGLFDGGVIVNQNHEVFVNGFELRFQPASTLTLGSGTFRSNTATSFGGSMTVAAPVGADSALKISGVQWSFENGSITTLNGWGQVSHFNIPWISDPDFSPSD